MDSEKLFENLKRLGFVMMEPGKGLDVGKTLAEVVKSKDARMWEGFPVLLANAAEEYGFDYDQTLQNLTDDQDKENFCALVILSLALYMHFHLSFVWASQLKKNLSEEASVYLQEFKKALAGGNDFNVADITFRTDRLITIFKNYFERDANQAADFKLKHEELSLEYALSQLFSPKQKELFKKKLRGAALTKTEKEYYSRAVKKKVVALANPELHRLAQKLLAY